MKPRVARTLLVAAVLTSCLAVGCGAVFTFYVAGLFGDGTSVPAPVWERTLRATFLLGPALGAFLVLLAAAGLLRWRTGVLPWATGALAVVFLARWDAGILTVADGVVAVALIAAAGWSDHVRRRLR